MKILHKKLTIEEMCYLARSRGGKCLSSEYVNARTKLIWQCENGHTWTSTPGHIKRGQWCPACAKVKKLTIEEMCKLAESRGGKCLSTEYINARTKLIWQCENGHIWDAIPSNVVKGHWCPECGHEIRASKQKLTIEEMCKLAESRGGKCLSSEYANARTNLAWQCKLGHIWKAKPHHIKEGHWCPKCANVKKLTLKEMQILAESCGGKCLSSEYINARTKLIWQCENGHTWKATPNKIQQERWCPYCSKGQSISEEICRNFFNAMFKEKFAKTRFEWLINDKGNNMELDGYNDKLNLAFEYQGRQHYKYIPFFHRDRKNFRQRLKDDKLKKKMCKDKGITLIEVPYTINYENMQNFIHKQCKERNVYLPEIKSKINYKNFTIYFQSKLTEMQNLADKRGGKCLSTEYINARTKLKWQCENSHIWEAIPDSIKRGSWCSTCAYKTRKIETQLNLKKS